MKRLFKKGIAFIIVSAMIVSLFPVSLSAYSFTGQDYNVTSNITLFGQDTGADYTRVHLGSGGSSGWGANRYINIVEANLSKHENLGLEVINHGSSTGSATPLTSEVANYSEDNNTILAAVNGDWMSYAKSIGVPVTKNYRVSFSSMLADGEIWCSEMSSQEQAADYYTMCITKDNQIVIDKPTVDTTIKNTTKGTSITPTGLNRAPVNNSLNVYNNRLNDSNYVSSDAYEVVITTDSTNKFYQKQAVTGTVTNIYPAGTVSRCGLTDNIVILTARGNKISSLNGKFSIGDRVSITAEIKCDTNSSAWANCEEAIGGQCRVMKGGKIVNDLSGADMNQYPTNIIGYKSDGTVMMCMVTADTNGKYVGLDFNSNIATFCKEVGYDTCFLFDGGGSTTMVTLDAGKYVERACYSDGHIRNVWNGLALVYDANANGSSNPPAPPVLSSASQIAAGETKLTQNITGNLTVTEGTYVIDLAGFTWSNDNVALEVDGTANVTIIDSVGGGKISVYPNDAINAYGGSLTLNGVTVEADGSGMDSIFVKAGNILVKNSTLIAPKAGIDASQSDTAATIVVDGGTFGVYAGAEDKSRSCAIEFRNDNKNITLKGDIKFENNVIIRRNDCTKELEQLITFGDESKDSTITNTDKTYSNDSNTWRFSTIDYKYTASSVPTAKPTTQPTTQPTAAPTAEPTAQPTAAPTAKPTETVVYPCIQTSHDAYAISTITAPTGYYLQSVTLDKAWVGIVFPGWAVHNDGTATFEVYAFDTDLDTSAAGAALLSETIQIKEIAQNEHRFATSLPAGKYVFKISNLGGTAPHFGIGQKLPDIDTDVAINEVAVSNEFDPNVHAVIINYITSGNSSENPSEPKETIIYPCIQTNHDAQGLTTVTTPSGFYLQSVTLDKSWVGIVYPGWCEPNDGTATFEVYAFDTDFDTSISGTAILSETIKVHQIPFNKHMFAKSLPAGKYVFKISNIAGTGVHFGIGQKLSNIDTEISIYEVAVSIPFDPTQHALIMNYIVSDISADEPNENTEHLIPSAGSNVVVDSNKAIASGIAAQSSTAAVIAQFKNSGNVQVVDKNGNVLSASALVGTGCKVQLVDNGTVKDEATIVIKGEIDGNGVIDSDDAIYLLRNTLFAGLYPVVTEDDVDGNGKYDSDDAIHLLRYTLFPNLYPLK